MLARLCGVWKPLDPAVPGPPPPVHGLDPEWPPPVPANPEEEVGDAMEEEEATVLMFPEAAPDPPAAAAEEEEEEAGCTGRDIRLVKRFVVSTFRWTMCTKVRLALCYSRLPNGIF